MRCRYHRSNCWYQFTVLTLLPWTGHESYYLLSTTTSRWTFSKAIQNNHHHHRRWSYNYAGCRANLNPGSKEICEKGSLQKRVKSTLAPASRRCHCSYTVSEWKIALVRESVALVVFSVHWSLLDLYSSLSLNQTLSLSTSQTLFTTQAEETLALERLDALFLRYFLRSVRSSYIRSTVNVSILIFSAKPIRLDKTL